MFISILIVTLFTYVKAGCSPGTAMDWDSSLRSCVVCPAGTYQPHEDFTGECIKCVSKQYSATTGTVECDLCPKGMYGNLQFGSTFCTKVEPAEIVVVSKIKRRNLVSCTTTNTDHQCTCDSGHKRIFDAGASTYSCDACLAGQAQANDATVTNQCTDCARTNGYQITRTRARTVGSLLNAAVHILEQQTEQSAVQP